MTDKEKLEKLFQAALSDSSPGNPSLRRAFPVPTSSRLSTPVAAAAPAPARDPMPAPAPSVVVETPAPAPATRADVEPLVTPMPNAGLDETTSNELGALLDQQIARKKRQRRRELITTVGVFLLITCGGTGWFVHSPERRAAFHDVMTDIRSAGDVVGMVQKYQKALDRVAERSHQIDEATASMGVTASAEDEKDPYMEAEMQQMMGGEGKTVGERNRKLKESFGHMKAGTPLRPAVPRS